MRKIIILLFLVLSGHTYAGVIRVVNANDAGAGSLREAIEITAVPGDTIIIDGKGTILLQTQININSKSNLTIIGPTAKHLTIQDAAGFPHASLFEITASSNINFSYIGFVGTGSTNTRAIRMSGNTGPISFFKCLFKDFDSNDDGGAIFSQSSTLNISSCSFSNNEAQIGGAIFLSSTSTANSSIVNCTFHQNLGVLQAGAIQVANSATVDLTHNTFHQNTAPALFGGAIYSNFASNNVTLRNNAISLNGTGDGQFAGILTSYSSAGGNVYRKMSAADVIPWAAHPQDDAISHLIPDPFKFDLDGILTDGYGLMYFTIVDPLSALVDEGVATTLLKDTRGAPRNLKSGSAEPANADAGACEYTALRVINPSAGTSTPNTLGWVFLPGQNYNVVNFVEFDLGSFPGNYFPDQSMNLNGNYIVDGYSNPGTAVPGPAPFGSVGVTPAILIVTVDKNASVTGNGFTISGSSTTGSISGLRIVNFNQGGISCAGDNFQIFGCEIGITNSDASAPNLLFGVKMDGDNGIIGGRWHWERNIVSGNGTGGGSNPEISITTGVTNTQILGNIIGLRRDGTTTYTGTITQYGIYDAGTNTQIGGVGAGNVISNKTEGINCVNTQNTKIVGNTIGMDYNQTVAKANGTGIYINSNCLNVEIGKPVQGGGNMISGNTSVGIRIDAANGVKVSNNFIGPDKTGNSGPAVTTTHGIYLDDNGANNVLIGGPNLLDRNIISKNGTGISVIRTGTGMLIQNNIIGLNATGNAVLSNASVGINVAATVINPVQIGAPGLSNVISGHSAGVGYGIQITGGASHIIQNNTIGLSLAGTGILANNYGIMISGSSNVFIGGDVSLDQGNVISGNTQAGIEVFGGASNTKIRGNFIGTDVSGNIALPNGSIGVWIADATATEIGGLSQFRNTISGHSTFGSKGISLTSTGVGTVISGNIIGQNQAGAAALGNYQGIHIGDSHDAYVGGVNPNYITSSTDAGIVIATSSPATVEGNVIGRSMTSIVAGMSNLYGVHVQTPNSVIGNSFPNMIVNSTSHGIFINAETADGTLINGNYIGTDASLTTGIGNDGDGIHIVDADDTEIGVAFGNTIIGNTQAGIYLTGSVEASLISNNSIYSPGGVSMTNQYGIYLENGPSGNFIGSTYGVDGDNTIGNSTLDGIRLDNADANFIYGNDIGNDGNSLFPNVNGIKILNSTGNIIGDVGGKRNVIGGNTATGILLENAIGTFIQSNLIGTNVTGNGPVSNNNGIEVLSGSNGTVIGGTGNLDLANTISANLNIGIRTESSTTSIYRNYIGPTQGGLGALAFQNYGIVVEPGAMTCVIGGEFSSQGNLIASNENAGILVNEQGVSIKGNIIGASGTYTALGSQPIGIELGTSSAFDVIIGSPQVGASEFGNVILNHAVAGIQLHTGAHDNLIQSNYIGIDPSNGASLAQFIGIEILVTAGIDNQIGSDVVGGQNRISGNIIGIQLDGAAHTFIYNNRIGLAIDELNTNANAQHGIHLIDAGSNTIGGTGLKSNIISGNTQNGILIEGASSTNNIVTGNIIGASPSLGQINPNGVGIKISDGASNNTIGEIGATSGNTICGNNFAGVLINNASSNEIYNNKIGLPFKNVHGIVIQNGSANNIVGGTPSERNIISNNDSMGVVINGSSNNIIAGNFIGTNENGNLPAGNKIGVFMSGSSFNTIGNQSHFNLISSNSIAGILIENSPSNTFKNNYLGTDLTGDVIYAGSGNAVGVILKNSNSNLFGGNNTIDEENIICNSAAQGIYLENSDLNEIYGNHIGINKNGSLYLGNAQQGIYLESGSDNNTIGSPIVGLSNSIAANSIGIYIKYSSSNTIASNKIGNNTDGSGTLSGTNNQAIGIHLDSVSVGNNIEELNIIGGNTNAGMKISGNLSENNTVSGNYFGIKSDGITSLSNGVSNLIISDSAHQNLIGGPTISDRNYFGGNLQQHIFTAWDADSNQIAGNYINLGADGFTTYNTVDGIYLTVDSKQNIIGGGLPGEGNTIVGLSGNGIRLDSSPNTKILGNRIGIKPDSSPGPIGDSGILSEGADNTWIGAYLPGSDSINIITNCNTGVNLTTVFVLNSSYGNVIGGNAIYNNTQQGIDLLGDDLVMPIDTNNSNIFLDNGGMDRPDIISAWNCTDGFTHVGFKFFASNALPNYHVEFYRNTVPDGSGYGEGEIYIGDFTFSPTTNYDTISINLGQTLAPGTVLTATITGVLNNTSEFSQQFTVTLPPPIVAPVTTDETCLGAANGIVTVIASEAYQFTWDGGTTWTAGNGAITATLPNGSYSLDALYLNGCTQSTPVILNPGPSLPFSYTIIPDTCGYSLGEILIDTVGTNLAGGSGSYSYTFNNGAFYGSLIDTLNLTTGTYSIGLQDITLGCFSNLDNVVVNEITDVDDESFVFDSFCALDTPVPASVATSGGVFSFDPMPIDGATINGTTGLIAGYVMGNTYSVVYTVGICNEKDTIVVQAVNTDIPSFTFPDFCAGSPQSITPVLPGGTFSFDPIPTDGATINSATGVISGSTGGIYGVNYLTNGFCPDDSTVSVTVFPTPPAPQIIATDSIYCGTETPAMLSVVSGTDVAQWMIGSSTSTVLSTADDFTPASLTIGSNYIYVVLSDGGSCLSAPDSINYILSDISVLSAGDDLETCIG
ncbi:MAG: right-handed parallel beta-helix repeat-containing protein, partial [Bacteroidia bacterium]|nr:right-handed parallel beta-helix repeat-containing protein [Bacteroidia bacterium]